MNWICPLVSDDQRLRKLSPRIYSASTMPAREEPFEGRTHARYDRQLDRPWQIRSAWGVPYEAHLDFVREAAIGQGPVLDAACGAMAASAEPLRSSNRCVIGADLSVPALEKARDRVGSALHMAYVQADIRRLPFRTGSFETVLFTGAMHLYENPDPILIELSRILKPGGRIYVSTLVLANRRVGNWHLQSQSRSGLIAHPRTSAEVEGILRTYGHCTDFKCIGNAAFAVLQRDGKFSRLGTEPISRAQSAEEIFGVR